jgi:hypothetical protein
MRVLLIYAIAAAGLSGITAGSAVAAVQCKATLSGGAATLTCTESNENRYNCTYSMQLTTEGGAKANLNGKFAIAKGARDVKAVSEERLGGRKITSVASANTQCTPAR